MIKIYQCDSKNLDINKDWNNFVAEHSQGTCYHLFEWQSILEKVFRLRPFYLYAIGVDKKICGLLPLFLSKSRLFGRYLTSIPFYNYGGILASSDHATEELLNHAAKIARQHSASHIELRQIADQPILGLPNKTSKVRMVLELPKDPQILWQGFKAKLRSQIKRAQRENMEVRVGGNELLDDLGWQDSYGGN